MYSISLYNASIIVLTCILHCPKTTKRNTDSKNMSEKKRTIKKLFGFSIGPIVNALIGVLSVPITTRILDPVNFGKADMYTLIKSISMPIILLGFTSAFTREYIETDDKKKLTRHSLFLPMIMTLIFCTILICFRGSISELLFNEYLPSLIILLAINIILQIVTSFSMLMIRMSEKSKLYSSFMILQRILSFVITISLLLFVNQSFRMIIWSQVLSYSVYAILLIRVTYKEWSLFGKISREYLWLLMKIGLPMVPVSLALWIVAYTDKMALRLWANFEEIGFYSGAMKIVALIMIIKKSFQNFWTPTILRWNKQGKGKNLIDEIGLKIIFIIVLAAMAVTTSKDVIIKYLGSSFFPSAKILPFLLFIPVMHSAGTIFNSGILITKKTYLNIIIVTVMASINVALNFILVPKYGGLGAAIATAASYTVYLILEIIISSIIWEKTISSQFIMSYLLFITLSFSTLLPSVKWFIHIMFVVALLLTNLNYILWGSRTLKKQLVKKVKS